MPLSDYNGIITIIQENSCDVPGAVSQPVIKCEHFKTTDWLTKENHVKKDKE
jgi:hypothetical protein